MEKFDISSAAIVSPPSDPFNLSRFLQAQESIYSTALSELASGCKRTHWMWFIFPQLAGLSRSAISEQFAIKNLAEAHAYLTHPLLGSRLQECTRTLLSLEGRSISEIFMYPDDLKLQSCLTLFECVADPGSMFSRLLDKYYLGNRDTRTLHFLAGSGENNCLE